MLITDENRRDKQARDIILRLVANFPGLVLTTEECEERDCDEEVNGADLVDWITNELFTCAQLKDQLLIDRAKHGTPCDDTPEGEAIEKYWTELWAR